MARTKTVNVHEIIVSENIDDLGRKTESALHGANEAELHVVGISSPYPGVIMIVYAETFEEEF